MLSVSFVSHYKLGDNYQTVGEDSLCRMALRYLIISCPKTFLVSLNEQNSLIFRLFQGPLLGDGIGEPHDAPPFLWRYPFKIMATGPGAGDLPFSLDSDLSPDLSQWNTTSPADGNLVEKSLNSVLLPIITSKVCDPLIAWIASEYD